MCVIMFSNEYPKCVHGFVSMYPLKKCARNATTGKSEKSNERERKGLKKHEQTNPK